MLCYLFNYHKAGPEAVNLLSTFTIRARVRLKTRLALAGAVWYNGLVTDLPRPLGQKGKL